MLRWSIVAPDWLLTSTVGGVDGWSVHLSCQALPTVKLVDVLLLEPLKLSTGLDGRVVEAPVDCDGVVGAIVGAVMAAVADELVDDALADGLALLPQAMASRDSPAATTNAPRTDALM